VMTVARTLVGVQGPTRSRVLVASGGPYDLQRGTNSQCLAIGRNQRPGGCSPAVLQAYLLKVERFAIAGPANASYSRRVRLTVSPCSGVSRREEGCLVQGTNGRGGPLFFF